MSASRMLPQAVASLPGNPTTNSYLICATHRSGSNLLCHALLDSGVAGKPSEFFSDTLQTRLAALLLLPENLAAIEFFRGAMWRTTQANGLFGVKVMQRHLQYAIAVIRSALGLRAQEADLAVLSELLPNPRFIWLRREKVVLQAISLARAKQTKAWSGRKTATTPVVFDFEQIDRCVGRIERANRLWEQWFRAQGIQAFQITYEQLIADYQKSVCAALEFIGQPVTVEIPAPRVSRQADSLNDEWAERYAELKNS